MFDAFTFTEGSVTVTLFGPVSKERELKERAIARHRSEQLAYVRPRQQDRYIKPERRPLDENERSW